MRASCKQAKQRLASYARPAGSGGQAGGSAAPAGSSGRTVGEPAGAAGRSGGGGAAAAEEENDDIPDIDELELEDAEEDEARGLPLEFCALMVAFLCSIH